ncbi:MAG: hypothetical protein D6704_10415 [Nitrospirae bacterium]|nr:MAG: hypothetical protein D6704_10415 [Nitrospirota bacterium]
MPKQTKARENVSQAISDYRHEEAKRKNNPAVNSSQEAHRGAIRDGQPLARSSPMVSRQR